MNLKGRGFRWWFIRTISLALIIIAYILLARLGNWPPYSQKEITELPSKDSTKQVEKKKPLPYVRKKSVASTPKTFSAQEKELLLKIIDVQKAAIDQKNIEMDIMSKHIESLKADSAASYGSSSKLIEQYAQELDDLKKSIGAKVSSIPRKIRKIIEPAPEPKKASVPCRCPKVSPRHKKVKSDRPDY